MLQFALQIGKKRGGGELATIPPFFPFLIKILNLILQCLTGRVKEIPNELLLEILMKFSF